MNQVLSDWKEKLITDGLRECKNLLPKQKDTMFDFYEGSIEGFEKCKKLNKLKDFERRLSTLNRKELNLTKRYLFKKDEKLLKEIWYVKGIRTQVEYVYNHLKAMNYLLERD